MNKEKNSYIFTYSAILVVLVAIALTLANILLTPRQKENVAVEKKWQILKTVGVALDADEQPNKEAYIKEMYSKFIPESFAVNVEGKVIDGVNAFNLELKNELDKPESEMQLPVFEYKNGNVVKYVLPVRGNGLWGPIWGYVALDSDFSTISGVVFDHESETPGLGAEITTAAFQKQFQGKKIFDGDTFTSVRVVKGGADPSNLHEVDGISGGTLTSNGLDAALNNCLKLYQAYFKSQMK